MNLKEIEKVVSFRARAIVSAIAALGFGTGTSFETLAQNVEGLQLEEVIVTATKREQRIQDVAATVRAMSSELLSDLDVTNLSDVVVLLPNVQIKSHPTGEVTIRGVSQSRLGQSPVAFHVNNIFKYSNESFLGQFYDLQNVEVVQGPTGTVYGRNSTAGAINIIQRVPVPEIEAFADVNLGNYSNQQFRGVVNVPFLGEGDERLMGRFVVQREKHDGYIDNKLAPDDKDYGAADDTFLRGSLRSVFSEDSEATLRGYWNENKNNYEGSTQALKEYPVGILGGFAPFDAYDGLKQLRSDPAIVGLGALNQQMQPELTLSEAVDDFVLNGIPSLGIDGFLVNDALFTPAQPPILGNKDVRANAFELGDPKLTVKGIDGGFVTHFKDLPLLGDTRFNIDAGWENAARKTITDIDGTELPVLDAIRDEDSDLYSGEVRLTSENDGALSWIAGVFYFERDYDLTSDTVTPFGNFGDVQKIKEDGLGIFLSGAYELTDSWGLFGGIRQNQDSYDLTRESGGGGIGEGVVAFSGDDEFSETTGEAGVKYSINDSDMVYLKWNHGYKAGSVEVDSFGVVNAVEPEKVDALESGVRTEWMDNRLRVNLTGFYYDYTDLQVPVITATTERTESAGEATIWGVELDGTYLLTPNWEISTSVGYLNAEFDQFCAADEYQIQQFGVQTDSACLAAEGDEAVREGTLDLSGNTLEDSPEWKAILLTSYDMNLGDVGNLKFILQSTWTDSYYLRPFNLEIDKVDATSRTDVRLLWRSPADRYSVEAYVENIEDDTNANRVVTLPDFTGGQPGYFGASLPRIYGVRFGYNFGS